MASYVIRGGAEGKSRLRVISQALWPSTYTLLNRAGITAGMTCLDVGCGGGDVTFEMARLVGPSGNVTGIDMDGTKIQLAQQEAEHETLANVTFRTLDIAELADEAVYDLVYARLCLTHLRDPLHALQQMMQVTKLDGVVVVEDMDHSGIFSYPASPALTHHISLYNHVVRLRGADPEIGPKLPALFAQAGLYDVQVAHIQPVFAVGDGKRIHRITLENITPAVIAAGLASEAEISALLSELDAFADNPQTLISFPRMFQVWARRT